MGALLRPMLHLGRRPREAVAHRAAGHPDRLYVGVPHLLRLLGRRPAGRAREGEGAGQARAAEVGDVHLAARLDPYAARLVAVSVGDLAPLAKLALRAEALGHRADTHRAPRAGELGRDVVHVHDDDPADPAELEVAGADGPQHVVAFDLGYGILARHGRGIRCARPRHYCAE